jgi:hypothetical protein
MLRYIYIITSGAALAFYAYMGLTGYEFGSPEREELSASVRHSPGYRSFHYWHSGPHGGK